MNSKTSISINESIAFGANHFPSRFFISHSIDVFKLVCLSAIHNKIKRVFPLLAVVNFFFSYLFTTNNEGKKMINEVKTRFKDVVDLLQNQVLRMKTSEIHKRVKITVDWNCCFFVVKLHSKARRRFSFLRKSDISGIQMS